MRGHVAKKGNRFYPVADIGVDPETGKRRLKWHKSCRTREEADAALVEIVRALNRGEYVAPSKGTVKSFLQEDWLPSARATLKPSTAKLYETLLDAYVIPRLGPTRLQALTAARLNAFYADLLAAGRTQGDGGLSATSVRGIHRVIHRALRDAVKWDRLSKNPAEVADPPRATRPTMSAWNASQVGSFLTNAAEDDDAPIWILLATTGIRRAEALGLHWPDVDLDAGRITVRSALSYVGTRAVLTEPKTSSSRRLVALPAVTVAALRGHKARQAAVRLEMGPEYRDLGFVFAGIDGAPMNPTTVSRRFNRLVEQSGLPRITLHGLRHSWATIALGAGVPAKVASEILGHSSISVTMDVYSHALPSMVEEATEQVAAAMFRGAR